MVTPNTRLRSSVRSFNQSMAPRWAAQNPVVTQTIVVGPSPVGDDLPDVGVVGRFELISKMTGLLVAWS
jgi:hypothetical protein